MAHRRVCGAIGFRNCACMTEHLVSVDWLAQKLGKPDVVVIDASWHLPTAKRDARAEFEQGHIPGAQFYDLDAGSDRASPLPHMLPPEEKFAADMRSLGVAEHKTVVVYDSVGLFSAARLWWMLRSHGHTGAKVLDGGLPKWKENGYPLDSGQAAVTDHVPWVAQLDRSKVESIETVAAALKAGGAVVDARSPARFRGEEAEPRPGVRPGHMAGATNVHYASLLNPDGTLKAPAELRQAFQGINLDQHVITSCGSGVTAAILVLALAHIGVDDVSLYDGSWAEWGASEQPVEKC